MNAFSGTVGCLATINSFLGAFGGSSEAAPPSFAGDYDINVFTRDHSDQWSLAYAEAKSLRTGSETIGIYGDDDTTSAGAEIDIDHGWDNRVTFVKEPDTVGVVESPILNLQPRETTDLNLRFDGITGVTINCDGASGYYVYALLKNAAGVATVNDAYGHKVPTMTLEQEYGDATTVTLGTFDCSPPAAADGVQAPAEASDNGSPGNDATSPWSVGGAGTAGGLGNSATGPVAPGDDGTILPTILTLVGVYDFQATTVNIRPQAGGSGAPGTAGGNADGGPGGRGGPGDEFNLPGDGGAGGDGGTGGYGGDGGPAGTSSGGQPGDAAVCLYASGPVVIAEVFRSTDIIPGGVGGLGGSANGGAGGPPGDDGGAGSGNNGPAGDNGTPGSNGTQGAESPATQFAVSLSGGATITSLD